MAVERSDFKVATYSVVSSMGVARAGASATGVGGMAGGPAAVSVRLQAVTASEIGLSRAPLHARHGTSRMKPSYRSRLVSLSASPWRRSM